MRQVLAAGEGTDSMKKIAAAVQEGANAYLARQLRTLGVFAVVVFFLLMLLPADDWNQRAGRSIFFSDRRGVLGGHRLYRYVARRTQQCARRRGGAGSDTGPR
ncbi:Putative K(+)-stimulated pyrophosphate-energized sodium pump [Streptomyces tendae]